MHPINNQPESHRSDFAFNLMTRYSMFDELLEGVQILSKDLHYFYVNDSFLRQSGKQKSELIGVSFEELFTAKNPVLQEQIKNCIENKVAVSMECKDPFLCNVEKWYLLKLQPVEEGLMIFSNDITLLKEIIQKEKEHLMMMEKLLLMTSHKIRQPAAQIIGLSSIFQNTQSEKEREKILTYVQKAAEDLNGITAELTNYIHNLSKETR